MHATVSDSELCTAGPSGNGGAVGVVGDMLVVGDTMK